MASEHLRPPPYVGSSSRGAGVSVRHKFLQESDDAEEEDLAQKEEDRVLTVLLEAFPGISLKSLAVAYAQAKGDPNIAAEILFIETTAAMPSSSQKNANPAPPVGRAKPPENPPQRQLPPNAEPPRAWNYEPSFPVGELDWEPKAERRIVEDRYGLFAEPKPPDLVHSDDFKKAANTQHQLKNGHGDFSGASVWRDSPILGSNGKNNPDSTDHGASSQFTEPNNNPDSTDHVAFSQSRQPYPPPPAYSEYPLLRRRNGESRSIALSASAPVYEYQGLGRVGPAFPVQSALKLSATTGSVSSQRQRRSDSSQSSIGSGSNSGGSGWREVELDDGLYSGNFRKKNKGGGSRKAVVGGESQDQDSEDVVASRRAAEEFLHSMLGGEIGLDVVRDVLGHYAGDTDKALETLLHMGSPVFVDTTNTIKDYNGNIAGTNHHQYDEGIVPDKTECGSEVFNNQETVVDSSLGQVHVDNELLCKLHESFPTVEHSFLAAVLQAADFSYDEAVTILQESGVKPTGEQSQQRKLNPTELLRTMFTTDTAPPERAGGFIENPEPQVLREPWTVVAARPRIRRTPDGESLESDPNGEENEYTCQRAKANEHWATMKTYMKEAAAAYGRGDRVHAGLLSEKGAKFKMLAQEAGNRASKHIFNVQNKDIENNITIDLHSQHVDEALKLLKLHLRSLSQIPSVQSLTIITGQGSHSIRGKAKIKLSLTRYFRKRQIPWTELNPGCIHVKMAIVRESQLNEKSSDSSDTDSF